LKVIETVESIPSDIMHGEADPAVPLGFGIAFADEGGCESAGSGIKEDLRLVPDNEHEFAMSCTVLWIFPGWRRG
jgi:hypothetical protein